MFVTVTMGEETRYLAPEHHGERQNVLQLLSLLHYQDWKPRLTTYMHVPASVHLSVTRSTTFQAAGHLREDDYNKYYPQAFLWAGRKLVCHYHSVEAIEASRRFELGRGGGREYKPTSLGSNVI